MFISLIPRQSFSRISACLKTYFVLSLLRERPFLPWLLAGSPVYSALPLFYFFMSLIGTLKKVVNACLFFNICHDVLFFIRLNLKMDPR